MADLSHALTTSINGLAAYGELAYTERQLYYDVCRTLRPVPGLARRQLPWALAIGLLPALLTLRRPRRAAALIVADVLVVEALHLLRRIPFTLRPPIFYDGFTKALHDYCAQHTPPSGLLPPPTPRSSSLRDVEPDLLDYGVQHLLVCQQTEVAHMLLANYAHIEWACPILTLSEAIPLPDGLQAMLRRSEKGRVYFLHNASPEGLALVPGLRHRLGVSPDIRITAMGLRPAQALHLHLFAERHLSPAKLPSEWPAYLSARERAWLRAGWQTETQALHPVRLLRALRRIMLGPPVKKTRIPSLRRDQTVGFMTWPA